MLTAQEGAGAAHAGLHLVHNEDKILFITEGAHSLHILGSSAITPPSPWISSSIMAQVWRSTSSRRPSMSPAVV